MSICTPLPERIEAPTLARAEVHVDRSYWRAVVLVTAVPIVLGFFRLSEPSVWFDESATWLNVSDGWRWMWIASVSGEDCGGFVYALVMKLWTSLFGYGEFALRAPSVVFAAAMAIALLEIGRGMGSLRAGVYMALCGALHPVVICWSRQARAYSLEMFLTATYLAIVLAYGRSGGRARAAALALVGSLLALTHVFGVFVVAGGTLFLLALRFDRSASEGELPVRRSLAPSIIACVLLGLWVFLMQGRVKQNLDYFWIDGSKVDKFFEVLADLMPLYGTFAILVVAGAGLLLTRRKLPNERRLILAVGSIFAVVLIGPVAASALSRGAHHFILPRYFLPGIVPVVVLAGYLLAALPRRLAVVGMSMLATAGIATASTRGVYSNAGEDGSRTRAASRYIADHFRKGDRLFLTPKYEETTLLYYGVPPKMIRGAGLYAEPEKLKELLQAEPPQPGTRNWVLVYHCDGADDLRGLGLAGCPQQRFGMIRLACVEATSTTPTASPPK